MTTTTGRVTSCCVALFLALTSVSAVQRLDSIDDLKRINFGQSVPKHSLLLLHWFANTVDITNTDVIILSVDPDSGDYGSHHYENNEGLLNPLPQGYRYYTVGNLYQDVQMQLPSYVLHPQSLEYVGANRDRIIIRVTSQNTGGGAQQSIDQVYITQHYDTSDQQGTSYDPDHTYQITTNLLRQIREFSVGQNQQTLSDLRNRYGSNADDFYIRNTWGHLACLGLFLFIVIQEKSSSNQHNNRPRNHQNHGAHESREVRKEMSGSNVPKNSQNQSEVEAFFKDDGNHERSRMYTSNPNRASRNCTVFMKENRKLLCGLVCCFVFVWIVLLVCFAIFGLLETVFSND